MGKRRMKNGIVQTFVVCKQKQSFAVKIQSAQGVYIWRQVKKILQTGFALFCCKAGNHLKSFVYDKVSVHLNSMKALQAKGLKSSCKIKSPAGGETFTIWMG
jgi:hypothetical protein